MPSSTLGLEPTSRIHFFQFFANENISKIEVKVVFGGKRLKVSETGHKKLVSVSNSNPDTGTGTLACGSSTLIFLSSKT